MQCPCPPHERLKKNGNQRDNEPEPESRLPSDVGGYGFDHGSFPLPTAIAHPSELRVPATRTVVRGLPALCIALAAHGHRWLARATLPLAAAVESCRSASQPHSTFTQS